MAFDFPASPTEGAVYTPAGGPTYTYTGGIWRLLPTPQTALSSKSIGDVPPLNPVHGQSWWKSDTGESFIWYVDANSGQWVQESDTSLPDAPSDGGFYVRSDGLWVPVPRYQRTDMTGLTLLTVQVPANALGCRVTGSVYYPNSTPNYLICQCSFTAGTFLGAAGDYRANGVQHTSVTTPTAISPITNNGTFLGMFMSNSHDNVGIPTIFDGQIVIKRPTTAAAYTSDFRSVSYSAAGACHVFVHNYVAVAVPTGGVMLAFRIVPYVGATFAAGSYITVEWM